MAGGASAAPATSLPAPTTGRTAVLVSVGLVLFLMLAVPVREWFAQRAQIAAMEAEISDTQNDLDALNAQRESWQDADYVEEQARLRLNYGRPGEVPLVVVTPDGSTAAVADTEPGTWYERLWLSVDAASGRADGSADAIEIRENAPR